MFYVYIDSTLDGRPYYVGKGDKARIKTMKRNGYHASIARFHGQKRVVVFETLNERWALEREVELIVLLKTRRGIPGNWGANLTNGGEGETGRIDTEETKRKRGISISRAKLGKSYPSVSKALMGKKHPPRSEVWKKNLSKANIGKKHASPTREAIETRNRHISFAKIGKKQPNVGKAKLSKKQPNISKAKLGKKTRCSCCRELGHPRYRCPRRQFQLTSLAWFTRAI